MFQDPRFQFQMHYTELVTGRTEIKGLDVTIHEITPNLSHIQVETIQQATKEDPTLQILMQHLIKGLLEYVKQIPWDFKPFWQLKDDLSIEHRCVLFQDRFYISQVLRSHCLKTLHLGHPGITKMRLRAQTSMYWIGIGKQIEDHMLCCGPCQIHSRSQQKEPAIPLEIPSRPWQNLRFNIFFHGSHWYVIIADYYSKYPWIKKLEAISSKDIISALKFCFAEFGIPEEAISDNGKQFTGRGYQDLTARYGDKLTTSSPYYPKGHGFIKRQVQTTKNLLSKCDGDGTDHYLTLLQLRVTPAGYLHLVSYCRRDNWKPLYLPSSGIQPIMKQSEHPFHTDKFLQTMILMPRSYQTSYLNNMCEYRIPWPNNGTRLLLSPRLKPPDDMLCDTQDGDKRNRIHLKGCRYSKSCAQCTTQSTRKCAK